MMREIDPNMLGICPLYGRWWFAIPQMLPQVPAILMTQRTLLSPKRARRKFALHGWELSPWMGKDDWMAILRGSLIGGVVVGKDGGPGLMFSWEADWLFKQTAWPR